MRCRPSFKQTLPRKPPLLRFARNPPILPALLPQLTGYEAMEVVSANILLGDQPVSVKKLLIFALSCATITVGMKDRRRWTKARGATSFLPQPSLLPKNGTGFRQERLLFPIRVSSAQKLLDQRKVRGIAPRKPAGRMRRVESSRDSTPQNPWSISVFLRITAMLYLFVFTQFRTENRYPLFLELL